MAPDNLEIQRRGYEHFRATGEVLDEIVEPEFVWDMSTFRAWPERQTYEGVEGMQRVPHRRGSAPGRTGCSRWRSCATAGDEVVAIVRQRGRSKETGLPVDMHFGQVWTYRDGKQLRMEMYADARGGAAGGRSFRGAVTLAPPPPAESRRDGAIVRLPPG